MLTKLLPDQVSAFWDVIKFAIEESLPPVVGEGPDKMNRILTTLLCGRAQCWASYNKVDETRKFEGLVVTKIVLDEISNTKNLLIYCLYGYEEVNKKSWLEGLKTLVKFATAQDCSRIIGYSDVPLLLRLAERLGGETKYSFVSIPLFNYKTEGLNDTL